MNLPGTRASGFALTVAGRSPSGWRGASAAKASPAATSAITAVTSAITAVTSAEQANLTDDMQGSGDGVAAAIRIGDAATAAGDYPIASRRGSCTIGNAAIANARLGGRPTCIG